MNYIRPLLLVGIGLATSWTSASQEKPFLLPPEYVGPPPTVEHALDNRAFQGISSMAVAPGGRLWATWYAGITPGEDHNNYAILANSSDDGKTWQEILIIDPDGTGPVRAFDPEIWLAPDGRLYFFWAQTIGLDGTISGTWAMHTDEPDALHPTWSEPCRLCDGIMMNKPTVLSTGEWVLPVSTWRKTDDSARMVVSSDQGKTWSLRGAANVPVDVRDYDEHMFIERKDGSLWMLVRTNYGIGESISTDRGTTWPEVTPTEIPHPNARFFIRRLASGNLLLVKHGSMEERTNRSHLTAFISKDDGKTWEGGLLLDARGGISYPDGQQAADGSIYITHDFSRFDHQHILFSKFREEDAAAGKNVSGEVRLKQMIADASGGIRSYLSNEDGEAIDTETPGRLVATGFDSYPLVSGTELFTDRKHHTAMDQPSELSGMHFIKLPIAGEKTLHADRAGTVYILTPAAFRNRDSQAAQLEKQGFKRVALQEFPLFAPPRPGHHCTLYQKDVELGETLTFGKWAVPVFLP